MARRNSYRYLGNSSSDNMEVHDLDQEDTNANGCQIDEIIRAGNNVQFTPDSLEQAHKEGYDNCAKCIRRSKR